MQSTMQNEFKHNEIYVDLIKKYINQITSLSIKKELQKITYDLLDIIVNFHIHQKYMKSSFLNALNVFQVELLQNSTSKRIKEFSIEVILKEFENHSIRNCFTTWHDDTIAFCNVNDFCFDILFNYFTFIIFDVQHYFEIFFEVDNNSQQWIDSFKILLGEFFSNKQNEMVAQMDELKDSFDINQVSERSKEQTEEPDFPIVSETENDFLLFEDISAAKVVEETGKFGTKRVLEGEKDVVGRFRTEKGIERNVKSSEEPLNFLRETSEKDIRKLCLRNRDANGFRFRSQYLRKISAKSEEESSEVSVEDSSSPSQIKTSSIQEIHPEQIKIDDKILKMQIEMDRSMKEKYNKQCKEITCINNSDHETQILEIEPKKPKTVAPTQEEKVSASPLKTAKPRQKMEEIPIPCSSSSIIEITENSFIIQQLNNLPKIEIIDGQKEGLTLDCVFDCQRDEIKNTMKVFVFPFQQCIFDEIEFLSLVENLELSNSQIIIYTVSIGKTINQSHILVSPSNRISCCKLQNKGEIKEGQLRLEYPILVCLEKISYYVVYYNYIRNRNPNDLIVFHVKITNK